MAEQRERMEKTLRGCAEMGVPGTVDLWPTVREQVTAKPRRSRRTRLVPRTRVGWAFAALLVMLFGMGAYGAFGPIYEEFRLQLPGAEEKVFGEKIDQTQTANGVRVDVEWAYADAGSVVLGFGIAELEEARRAAGYPAQLEPAYPNKLTDESGTGFCESGGQYTSSGPGQGPIEEVTGSMVFEAKERIEPGQKHRFRLEVPVAAHPLVPPGASKEGIPYSVPVGEPFVFDFEIPVRPSPTVEVGQDVTANGVTLTLERVVDSPARSRAVFCFEPPVDDYYWFPIGAGLVHEGGPVAGKGSCAEVLLADRLEGRSSLTVTKIEGMPQDTQNENWKGKTIRGPWTFEFEAPEQ